MIVKGRWRLESRPSVIRDRKKLAVSRTSESAQPVLKLAEEHLTVCWRK
jgi:hypothetical protein